VGAVLAAQEAAAAEAAAERLQGPAAVRNVGRVADAARAWQRRQRQRLRAEGAAGQAAAAHRSHGGPLLVTAAVRQPLRQQRGQEAGEAAASSSSSAAAVTCLRVVAARLKRVGWQPRGGGCEGSGDASPRGAARRLLAEAAARYAEVKQALAP
jgi:hypothetical protein